MIDGGTEPYFIAMHRLFRAANTLATLRSEEDQLRWTIWRVGIPSPRVSFLLLGP